MNKGRIVFFLLVCCSFFTSFVLAADKVVIIPLMRTVPWVHNDIELYNVVTVSPSGGDFTDPVEAINSITAAGPDNPFLMVIGPGIYSLTQPLAMKSYVSIRGAGEELTKLTGAISSNSHSSSALISGDFYSAISDLTIKNTGGGTHSIALYNYNYSPSITNVTLIASGGTNNYGVYNSNRSSPTMIDVTITAIGGTDTYGIYNYDESSPTMTSVTATGTDGTINRGVYNGFWSSPSMTDVNATGSGGNYNYGVHNHNGSSPTMTFVTATASGASHNYGVLNTDSSSPVMTSVTATGSGLTETYGVYSTGSSATLRHCTVKGATAGVHIYSGQTKFTQSSIIGGISVGNWGRLICINSDNGIDTALNTDCEVP